MRIGKTITSYLLLIALLGLVGCGVKGDLYLPDEQAETAEQETSP